MLLPPAGMDARGVPGASVYMRHRPERTLLYQIVEEYLPDFRAHLALKGVALADFVEQEVDAYLACGGIAPATGCHRQHLPQHQDYQTGYQTRLQESDGLPETHRIALGEGLNRARAEAPARCAQIRNEL